MTDFHCLRELAIRTGDTDEVKALFADDFEYDEGKQEFYKAVTDKLKAIKVLDPACGSGAFPIGMLNRIVELLQNLKAPGSKYDLKLQIMENCIYGGDIQTIAAQITKLRFFISLVCDCKKSDNPDENYGIPNLPNLETHFVSCDSLIALKKPNQYNLFEQDVIALKKKLQAVRHEHFMAKTVYQKTKLRNRDKELRDELAQMLTDDNVIASADAKQLVAWNPYDQNGKASFFDPEWMFGIKDGFDVVIGNPPYIQLQNNGGELAIKYEKCEYKTFARTGDIYCLFYERGWQLLKRGGHLCFITSNKWMRASYGEKTREFFATKTNPMLLIDFAGVKIFESATVDTNILLFAKADNRRETICAVTNKENKDSVNNLSDLVQQQNNICDFSSSDSWVIISPIEQSIKRKIEAVGTPLKDWDIQINYGIKTGFNDAFIISSDKRNEILSNCQSEDEQKRTADIIRPVLRGRDIKRYGYVNNGLYLINTHNGVKGKFPRINIDDYPAVKAHLDQYWDKISIRADKGDTPYNLRNCAYLDLFFQPHICWKAVGRNLTFAIVPSGTFLTAPASFISAGDKNDYILAFLCSKIGKYYIYQNSDTTGAGDIMLNIQSLIQFPIPSTIEHKIIELCKELQKNPSCNLQDTLDSLIYKSYGFSTEEINEIERC